MNNIKSAGLVIELGIVSEPAIGASNEFLLFPFVYGRSAVAKGRVKPVTNFNKDNGLVLAHDQIELSAGKTDIACYPAQTCIFKQATCALLSHLSYVLTRDWLP